MAEIKATITLDSNGFASGAKEVISNTDNMIQELQKFKENIESISKEKCSPEINANTENATKQIAKVKESLMGIRQSQAIIIEAKDNASKTIHNITKSVSDLTHKTFSFEIKAIDKTKSVISGISDKLFSLKTLAAGIVLGGIGKGAADLTLGNAMSNEQYLSTLQTVLHSNEQGSSALKWSYKEAAQTPFDAKEVVAGVTQLATNGLDFKKYLEPLGDAAAAFNKPLEQAIFAMGKLKSGQLGMGVDMLRDFGISNTDWQKNGAVFSKNGELSNMSPEKATETALKMLQSKYGGLMNKQSGTAQGMISNIGDTINNMGRGFAGIDNDGNIMKGGLFDNFKKQLTLIMPLLDKFQKSTVFKDIQKDISNLATIGGQKLSTFLKSFDNAKKVAEYKKDFHEFIAVLKDGGTIILDVGKIIGKLLPIAKPFFDFAAKNTGVLLALWGGAKVVTAGLGFITMVGNASKAITEFKKAQEAATLAEAIFNVVAEASPFGIIISAVGLVILGLVELAKHWKEICDWLDKAIAKVKEFFGYSDEKQNDKATNLSKLGMPGMTSAGNMPGYKQPSKSSKTDLSKLGVPGMTSAGNLPGFNALGTDYWKGGETWVGENGPEKLILPGGSKILSNRQSMNTIMPNMNQPNMSNNSMGLQANKWGQDIPEGMAKGIKNNTKSVTDATTFMAAKIRELIHFTAPDKGPLQDFDTYPVDMMKTFGIGITNNTKLVTDPTTDMSTGVQNIYSDLTTKSGTSATQAMQEFAKGIQDSESNILSIVSDLGNKIITQFKVTFGIASPSRVMRKLAGYIPQGVVLGLQDTDIGAFIKKWIGDVGSLAQNGMGDVMKMILQPMYDSGDNKGIISMVYNLLHGGGIGGAVGGNVAEWILAGMMAEGAPSSWLVPLEMIASRESGNPGTLGTGDPTLVNGVGVGNEYATGLMQVLPSTFRSFFGTDEGILNPVMSVRAAIREINQSWGGNPYNIPGLMGGGGYKGYANGGIATTPSIFGEGQYAEAAIPLKKNSSRSQQLLNIADSYINGDKKDSKDSKRDVNIYVIVQGNMVGNEEIADEIGEHIIKKVRAEIDNI